MITSLLLINLLFLNIILIYLLNPKYPVDKPIKIIHLLCAVLGVIFVIATGWVNINVSVAELRVRTTNNELQWNSLQAKSDKIIDKLETVTVLLASKQDRANDK